MMQMKFSYEVPKVHRSTKISASEDLPPPYDNKTALQGFVCENTSNRHLEVTNDQETARQRIKGLKRSHRVAICVLLILLVTLVITGITLSLLFAFRDQKSQHLGSVDVIPLTQLAGPLPNIVTVSDDSKSQLIPMDKVQSQTTSIPSQTDSKICVTHCYDTTYVACPCNENCKCPDANMKKSLLDQMASKFKDLMGIGGSGTMDSSLSISQYSVGVTDLCIALCGPDFTPLKVSCDKLLYACDY